MNITTYGDETHAILKLDPRTKLYIFIVSGIVSLNCFEPAPLLVYGAALCGTMALLGKAGYAIKAYLFYAVILYIKMCVDASPVQNSIASVVQGITMIIVLFIPIMVAFSMVMRTTRISHFLAALSNMKMPTALTVPVAVFFRFIPTVQEEWIGIRKAMAFRGISMGVLSVIRHPLRAAEYMLIPLLFSCMSVMEELAAAAIARGLDSEEQRSSYEEAKLCAVDYVFIAVFTILLVYYVAYGRRLLA